MHFWFGQKIDILFFFLIVVLKYWVLIVKYLWLISWFGFCFLGKVIHAMVAHLDAVTSLAVDPNGIYLMSGSKSGWGLLLFWKFNEFYCVKPWGKVQTKAWKVSAVPAYQVQKSLCSKSPVFAYPIICICYLAERSSWAQFTYIFVQHLTLSENTILQLYKFQMYILNL